MNWKAAVIVFLTTALYDYAVVVYFQSVANHKRFKAANTSSLLVGLGAILVISYQSSHWYTIPAAMGAWIGVYLGTPPEPPN